MKQSLQLLCKTYRNEAATCARVLSGQVSGPSQSQWRERQFSSSLESPQETQKTQQMRGRLLYRSKQRGWLELDLLVGGWAEKNLGRMDPSMLKDFSTVLDQENPELFKWLTGQDTAPDCMQQNTAFKALKDHVSKEMAELSQLATRAPPGKAWVRGWDDVARKAEPSA